MSSKEKWKVFLRKVKPRPGSDSHCGVVMKGQWHKDDGGSWFSSLETGEQWQASEARVLGRLD